MSTPVSRRQFIKMSAAAASLCAAGGSPSSLLSAQTQPAGKSSMSQPGSKPNVVFVFGDQWRAQALGYAGDPTVKTPNIDRLAASSVNFRQALSGYPVCTPYRGSLLTGQFPMTHGLFINDVPLSNKAVSIAQAFAGGGYQTAYIGKWHVDGSGDRAGYIPPNRRQGFEFWKVLECTHNYNHSPYYAGDSDQKLTWEGYDAIAQTREAQRYINEDVHDKPFLLMLSWGPPHENYFTAPQKYRDMYKPADIKLRPNVPDALAEETRKNLAGYYAHCTALDDCVGDLLETLRKKGLLDNTIFVFTSDHGDMVGSQGQRKKQRPWEESVRIPLLIHWPAGLGSAGRVTDKLIDAPDMMPTLLSLAGLAIPKTVEGRNLSAYVRSDKAIPEDDAVMISCVWPFGQFVRAEGGREYRAVRTQRYTYARDLNGPWLLYDNQTDPNQLKNLVNDPALAAVQAHMEQLLQRELTRQHDELVPGQQWLDKWGYKVNDKGVVPYIN